MSLLILVAEPAEHQVRLVEVLLNVDSKRQRPLGIAPQIVMKWTGHKEYSAMKPYMDVAAKVRKGEMSKFDQR